MECQKHLFQFKESVTYLNCGYMSPQLKRVEEAGIKGLKAKRNPFNISTDDFFGQTERLRTEFAKTINAAEANRITVIPSVSYGMANVAHNLSLSFGDEIVVVGEQFPSNVYPWQSLARKTNAKIITVSAPDTLKDRGRIWNEEIIEAINPRTKLVALGNIHWADGTLFDLKSIRKKSREYNAWLVIDGTQSVGALPFDVQEIEPDALVCAGYKWLMGPYSMGLAYYGSALDEGTPVEENWINRYKSEDFANLVNYNDGYQHGALRYEVGEHSNFILVPMMLEAIKQINTWGPINIQAHCRQLIVDLVPELHKHGFWIEDDKYRASHLFGIRLAEHHDMEQIQQALKDENIIVSYRGDSIRISPNIYNEKSELDKLAEILVAHSS
ncbi:MAG: aminotransferase class V-fold PLP-dependent enzyme [Balneolaceae bacterium]|nr:aminotransferase class V-fold PLP-dependent enzyme [Balneolaceae bacterium]